MAEFSIIDRFCREIGAQHAATKISVGDDAAVVAVPTDMELAISLDTMVEGVHFFSETEPEKIAHKLLAVNLSDMAAMGAKPKWATLALTLPEFDQDWLQRFSTALDKSAKHYGLELIGGDTTQGPLNLSINIMGLLPKGNALTRAKAKVNHDVYVSNTIGDAALALQCIEGNIHLKGLNLDTLKVALELPEPQTELGQHLLGIASSCVDISDGLIADLGHIAKQSQVSFELNVERIPLSSVYRQYVALGGKVDLALHGGDDYQLAFTAKKERRGEIKKITKDLDVSLSRIGKVIEQDELAVKLVLDDKPYELSKETGYEHFKT